MKIFGIPYHPRQLYYVLGDVLCVVFAVWAAHALRFGVMAAEAHPRLIWQEEGGIAAVFIVATVLILFVADAYNVTLNFRRPQEIVRLWLVAIVTFVLQVGLYFVLPELWWGRGIAGLTSLSLGVALTVWRPMVSRISPGPVFRQRTLLVGQGEPARIIADVIRGSAEHREVYQLVGCLDYPRFGHRRAGDTPSEPTQDWPIDVPMLGTVNELTEVATERRIDLIIVAIRGTMGAALTQKLLECKARGVQIEEMPTIYKQITGKVPILHLSDAWLIFGPVFSGTSRVAAAVQRLFDLVIGFVGLVLSAPIVAVAGVAVRLESPGPAFFLQERLGRNEQPFKIIKLRTMRNDAEASTGAVWSKGANDPRVTTVGRFLRRTRIDELPQFYNVFRGDMSMVGPRPEREFFVRQLKAQIPFYALRFSVKPGVTGWAQVNYRYGASTEESAEKLCYELYAIQELSPVLYGLIMLKTVQTMLFKAGS